jgi:hypothetical protein
VLAAEADVGASSRTCIAPCCAEASACRPGERPRPRRSQLACRSSTTCPSRMAVHGHRPTRHGAPPRPPGRRAPDSPHAHRESPGQATSDLGGPRRSLVSLCLWTCGSSTLTAAPIGGRPSCGCGRRSSCSGWTPWWCWFVETGEKAQRLAFPGSATVLVDGRDPLADPTAPVGLACRVSSDSGRLWGAPTV